jgi:hypothetical protein
MLRTATLAEVQRAGVTIQAEEAVAIVQQLIEGLRHGDEGAAEPPYGPPTPDTVHLGDDGSVACRACEATPAVSEIAILLQAMLPLRTSVPGGLRYTIARALLDVDVPPFDSLDDFSDTLTRYERGSRCQIVRRVLDRFDARRALVRRSAADRRRHPHTTELRRALREADARLYQQKVATQAVATAPSRPARLRNPRAAAACVGAGLLLIGAGELIDNWERSLPTGIAASVPAVPSPALPLAGAAAIAPADLPSADLVLVTDAAAPAERRAVGSDRRAPSAGRRASAERRAASAERRAADEGRSRSAKRALGSGSPQPAREAARKTQPRSMLERLRLNWLRNVLTSL